jgi:hypothetical protein
MTEVTGGLVGGILTSVRRYTPEPSYRWASAPHEFKAETAGPYDAKV